MRERSVEEWRSVLLAYERRLAKRWNRLAERFVTGCEEDSWILNNISGVFRFGFDI